MNTFITSLSELLELFQESFLFNILVNVVSSFLFIFVLLYSMRPNIKISPSICHAIMGDETEYYYIFKIVNKSMFYTFDVTIDLIKQEPYMVNKGKKINHRLVDIPVSSNSKNHLPRNRRKEGYGDHAYLIRTKENIDSLIREKDVILLLTVSSSHGLTNLTRVITQEFSSSDVIFKDKEFKFGSCLDVV